MSGAIFYTYFHTRNDTGKAFYVGKGRGRRAYDSRRNRHWCSVAEKHGYEVHIAARWATEAEAFEHEKFLILCFRSIGIPLVNQTDGGEGLSGYKCTPEQREQKRQMSTGRKHSSETKTKISASQVGKTIPQVSRQKMSVSAKIRASSPEFIARNTGENNPMKRADVAARNSAAQLGKKLSEEHKAKIGVAGLGRKGANAGRTFGPETRAKMSAAGKGRPKSEEHKRKISEANKAFAAKQKEVLE